MLDGRLCGTIQFAFTASFPDSSIAQQSYVLLTALCLKVGEGVYLSLLTLVLAFGLVWSRKS
ncbi:hypothetical protein ECB98_20390 [Brucellaceae bacterium VT-16-1752]|nr:hypothetical protein ECB98_20390 [Brucellaceae bacterium VT-16-1752]